MRIPSLSIIRFIFNIFLRKKVKLILRQLPCFLYNSPSFFSSKSMILCNFLHLLADTTHSSYLWPSWHIRKVFYAPMVDFDWFSKPLFVLIRMEYLCIQIYDVIIYFGNLFWNKVRWFKLIQYIFVLCTKYSLIFYWIYACFQAIVVSSVYISLD